MSHTGVYQTPPDSGRLCWTLPDSGRFLGSGALPYMDIVGLLEVDLTIYGYCRFLGSGALIPYHI